MRLRAMALIASACTMLPIGVVSPSAAQPTPEQTEWIKAHAIPLKTVVAGSGFDDLQPLKQIIGEARIVGLGEATHGTREHFQIKHRLLEFLVEEMGFSIFSIEASMPEAYRVDQYVSEGKGDPAQLIGGMYFWTWNTEEVLEMVKWMRAFNGRQKAEGSPRRVRFTGFDMQTPDVAMRHVESFVKEFDQAYTPELQNHWSALEANSSKYGFAAVNAALSLDTVRGKKVKLSGWIRTEAVARGWAGFWIRADGPDRKLLGFDNMMTSGPRGTTVWTQHAVELAVPDEAHAVVFGTLLAGPGKAWFDHITLEVDGAPLQDPKLHDLGFEGEELTGLRIGLGEPDALIRGYDITLSPEQPHDGAQSLLIASSGISSPEKASKAAAAVLEHLTASRDRYITEGAPRERIDWAIQMARVIEQGARMKAAEEPGRKYPDNGFAIRDQSMAQNIAWIAEQDPDAKIVLWAHNAHMSTVEPYTGQHLRNQFGKEYLAVGFTTTEGSYYAMPGDGGQSFIHELAPPPPSSVESMFRSIGHEIALLDLRASHPENPASAWVHQSTTIRFIGAMATPQQFMMMVPARNFDLIIYTGRTTAARQLQTPPGPIEE